VCLLELRGKNKMIQNKTHILFWVVILGLICWFISSISSILLPFVVGMGVAYMLDPMADNLEMRGLSRTIATVIISTIFFLTVLSLCAFLLPLLAEQLRDLIVDLPKNIDNLRDKYGQHLQKISKELHLPSKDAFSQISEKLTDSSQDILGKFGYGLVKSGLSLMNFLGLLLITPVVSYYLLKDWDKIVAKVDDLLPHKYAPTIREQVQEIDKTIAAFLRGTVNVMLVLIVFYAVALLIAGLPYSLLVAIISGVSIIVPFVGTLVSAGLALGIAYIHSEGGNELVIAVGAIFAIGQVLESYVLTPRMVGKSVGLNPLWIIFGMMAGGVLFGFVGVLLAVPLTAVFGVLIRFAIAQYKKSEFYGA
jgi:predicted PurR-regulated permease PerM